MSTPMTDTQKLREAAKRDFYGDGADRDFYTLCSPQTIIALCDELDRLRAGAGEPVAWACVKCNSPRSVDPCPKCGTPLTKPADGWEWPGLPDIARIRELAREVGYAIGVHGSMERDLDLIAAPWVAEAVGPAELAEHIAVGLGGQVHDFLTQDKPCGRWSCNIHTPKWEKMIDLSVMPPAAPPAPEQMVAVKPLEWPAELPRGKRASGIGLDGLVTYTIAHYGGDDPNGPTIYRWATKERPWSEPFASYDEAKAAAQADYESRIRGALASPPAVESKPTHRHKKRGTEYVLIGFGRMQTQFWYDGLDEDAEPGDVDMREVAIYRSVDDGSLWVRPREEFEDGRFEALADAKGAK